MNVELYPCSGGFAEGFRRAGITFGLAFDADPNACDSYEQNLGHRPVQLDVRDLLAALRSGDFTLGPVRLLVADPPCTPWSRAGKRLGVRDERDMLNVTIELIRVIRPDAYLIGNIPGLDDSTQWHHLQAALAPLGREGYCIRDYASLDAADHGTPQNRVRPFWFGHLAGPCIRWPAPTHAERPHPTLPGFPALKPWVTCRQALQHLPLEQLGRPVRLKRTTGEMGGRVLAPVSSAPKRLASGELVVNGRHSPASPAPTLGAKRRHQGAQVLDVGERVVTERNRIGSGAEPSVGRGTTHAVEWPWERPATTVMADPRLAPPGHHDTQGSILTPPEARGTKKRPPSTRGPQSQRVGDPDAPSTVLDASVGRVGKGESIVKEWPWERPSTTVCAGIDKIAPAGEHAGQCGPNAVVLSLVAARILQGLPETWVLAGKTKKAQWSQVGQLMPPPLAEAVAHAVRAQMEATEGGQEDGLVVGC